MATVTGRSAMPSVEPRTFAPFEPPEVAVGALVFFYPTCDRSQKPYPAEVVTANRTPEVRDKATGLLAIPSKPLREIGLQVVTEDGLLRRDSVRHLNDPTCAEHNVRARGAWDFRPPSLFEAKLLAAVDQLTARVSALEELVSGEPTKAATAGSRKKRESEE